MNSGLRRVNSLELLMRESSSYHSQQGSSNNHPPNEVSTLGSDNMDTKFMTQEDCHPPQRTSYKTSHFESILQSQRHTELIMKLERNQNNTQVVISKLQDLEDSFSDMGSKLLSVEANLTLLSQLHSETSSTTTSLLLKLLNESTHARTTMNNCSSVAELPKKLKASSFESHIVKKRKVIPDDDETHVKRPAPAEGDDDEQFVEMADYLKVKHVNLPRVSACGAGADVHWDSRVDDARVGRRTGGEKGSSACRVVEALSDSSAVSDITTSPPFHNDDTNDDFIFNDM